MNYETLAILVLSVLNLVLLIILLVKSRGKGEAEKVRETLDRRLDAQDQKNSELRNSLEQSFSNLRLETGERIDSMRRSMDALRSDNNAQLDQMRRTVDEKLDEKLETRLSASFEQVRQQLESVYKGLGEMQSLAKDVGDLSRIFTNVKSRGMWGEVQVRAILEDILAPGQYEMNFHPKPNGREVVEFAIKLPGKNEGENVYLPIDSKFPREDYENLAKAQEAGDAARVNFYRNALKNRVKSEAADVKNKYINPPRTTDFAILFLPTESLYAEVLSMEGIDRIQSEFRVTLAGPTTLSALVNSLQMGFRSLAVEKRTHEVWRLFAQMKKQFASFAEAVEDAEASFSKAGSKLEAVSSKTQRLGRSLDRIELPESEENDGQIE